MQRPLIVPFGRENVSASRSVAILSVHVTEQAITDGTTAVTGRDRDDRSDVGGRTWTDGEL